MDTEKSDAAPPEHGAQERAEAWGYLDRHRRGKQSAYNSPKPEYSLIEPGTASHPKYLAAGAAFVLLGIVLYRLANSVD